MIQAFTKFSGASAPSSLSGRSFKLLVSKPTRLVKLSAVPEFCVDLTARVGHGLTDPLLRRKAEVHRVLEILGQGRNGLLLVEEGGQAKGDIEVAEGVASVLKSHRDSAAFAVESHMEIVPIEGAHGLYLPPSLQGKRLVSLDMVTCQIASSRRGLLEEVVMQLVADLIWEGDTILFIENVHTLLRAETVLYLLKSALRWQQFQCIASTTLWDYGSLFKGGWLWELLFEHVWVEEEHEVEAEHKA